jgi:hypothetical protein
VTAEDDIRLLQRRIDTVTRAATRIRQHLADLHWLAWEKPTGDTAHVKKTTTDHTPKAGDTRARNLWSRLSLQLGQIEDQLVGLERQVTAHFYAGSQNAEPSRGSLISREEFDWRIGKQRRRRANGEYTPAPLIDQPPHPGKARP